MKPNWRVKATIDRLIGNIPAACNVLRKEGHTNLADQLERDRDNLVCWTHGGQTMEQTLQALEQLRDELDTLIDAIREDIEGLAEEPEP